MKKNQPIRDLCLIRYPCNSPRWVLDSPISVETRQSFQILDFYDGGTHQNFQKRLLDPSK